MGKLLAVENVSLDGVMQSPGRADEDTREGFSRGGWATEMLMADPEAMQASMPSGDQPTAMLFGRRTYDDLVGHWLTTDDPNPFTDILRAQPKYVASRSGADLPHPNSHRLEGDAVEAVRALKSEFDMDFVLLGSGELLHDLAAAGLVDEYLLTILPVVLGSGRRLFGDTYAELEVVRSYTSPTGIVVATYRVARS